jgi:hypothetical protein
MLERLPLKQRGKYERMHGLLVTGKKRALASSASRGWVSTLLQSQNINVMLIAPPTSAVDGAVLGLCLLRPRLTDQPHTLVETICGHVCTLSYTLLALQRTRSALPTAPWPHTSLANAVMIRLLLLLLQNRRCVRVLQDPLFF